MGNCCESKKRKTIYDATEDLNDMGDLGMDDGGILGDSQKLFDDDLVFDAYIEENLEEPDNHKEPSGMLTFDYFIKVYKTALIWNRIKFADKKKEMLKHRRNALKNNDMERYRAVHIGMSNADETCLQDVLEEILIKVNLPDKLF